jgi:hypothetical protein
MTPRRVRLPGLAGLVTRALVLGLPQIPDIHAEARDSVPVARLPYYEALMADL